MKEAMFYEKLKDGIARCTLCPHFCAIQPGKRGKCGVRENQNGTLYSLVYEKPCAAAIDPIEKKPFFHFMPNTLSYSIATVGCNLSCRFCQNYDISQGVKPDGIISGKKITPERIVEEALKNSCKSISYTYTEPTIFFEYAYDIAKLAKQKGLKNVFVSNGFINPEPIEMISDVLDAINIDLKGFSDEYYSTLCGARLQPILDAIRKYHENGVWLEITTLIVPGHNDGDAMLKKIAQFIASVDKKIPWHISRFYPHYLMRETKPTATDAIHMAIEIGKKEGLRYIYSGNMPGDDNESTFCPHCGKKVIERVGFDVVKINLESGRCGFCNSQIDVIL